MAKKRTNYDKSLERHLRQALLYTWRKDSIENCGGKCVITGENFDVVHHLHPCNLITKETMGNLKLQKYKKMKSIKSFIH